MDRHSKTLGLGKKLKICRVLLSAYIIPLRDH